MHKLILALWPQLYCRKQISIFTGTPKRYMPSLGFDSPKWTYISSTDTCARSWINHAAPFFAWKVHLLHRGKLILIAIHLRIPVASFTNCFMRLWHCFCRLFDGWKSVPIAWRQGPYHYWNWQFRPAIASWRVGSIGVADILWVTYPFQVIFSIVAAIAVDVIHLPGRLTGWRLQKRVSNQTVHTVVMSPNFDFPVAGCCWRS